MFKRILPNKLSGTELFKNSGDKSFSVLEFWQYAFSNLNSNILRGALAEFIVENALSEKSNIMLRNPWGDYDMVTASGVKIEVKCSSYLQDWDQKALSSITWTGLKAKELFWSSAVTPEVSKAPRAYKADIYVFALFKHQEPLTLDILDMNQWCFFALSRGQLEKVSGDRNSISLKRLEKAGLKPIEFGELKGAIMALSRAAEPQKGVAPLSAN